MLHTEILKKVVGQLSKEDIEEMTAALTRAIEALEATEKKETNKPQVNKSKDLDHEEHSEGEKEKDNEEYSAGEKEYEVATHKPAILDRSNSISDLCENIATAVEETGEEISAVHQKTGQNISEAAGANFFVKQISDKAVQAYRSLAKQTDNAATVKNATLGFFGFTKNAVSTVETSVTASNQNAPAKPHSY